MEKDNREVDRLARDVSAWWKKSLRYATLKQILTWKAMFILLFIAGVLAGIIWSVQLRIESRSKASGGSATLTWSANSESDLAGYNIYFGTAKRTADCYSENHGYTGKISIGNTTSYTINNLEEGQTYYFSVTAVNSGGESCFSAEVSKSVPAIVIVESDSEKPTVTITNPADGSTVSGTITAAADASDPDGIAKVAFYVGTSLKHEDTSAPYTYSWDTTAFPDGENRLTAWAYDNTGRSNSIAVYVQVKNASSVSPSEPVSDDTTAPTVTIANPEDGATVSGNVGISATATDDNGIVLMNIFIDGLMVSSSTSGSISYRWNTGKAAAGSHDIVVKAADAAGNTGSSSINVTIVSSPPGKIKK